MWLGMAGVGAGLGGEVAEGVEGGAGEGNLDKLVEDVLQCGLGKRGRRCRPSGHRKEEGRRAQSQ